MCPFVSWEVSFFVPLTRTDTNTGVFIIFTIFRNCFSLFDRGLDFGFSVYEINCFKIKIKLCPIYRIEIMIGVKYWH